MARPGFYDMIRRPLGVPRGDDESPWGMPDISGDDGFHQAFAAADEMKNRDLMRQKEMMTFSQQMRQQREAPDRMAAIIERGRQLNPANKKYVLGAGSGSGKLPPSTVEADNAARDAKVAKMNQDFAAINERRDENRAEREADERIADKRIQAGADERAADRKFRSDESAATRKFQGEQGDKNRENARIVAGIRTPNKADNSKTVQDIGSRAQEALDELKNVLDDKGNLTSKGHSATGWSSFLKYLPGTEARSGNASIKRVGSQQVLNVIAELKAQSRTGATGFGNMSNKDLATLENAAHKLDTLQDDEEVAAELRRIRDGMKKIVEGAAAHAAEESKTSSKDPIEVRRKRFDDLLKARGY